MTDIVLIDAKRTAIGDFMGQFANVSAPELGASVIKHMCANYADSIDYGYIGCVLPAGIGQAPARQAMIKGGLGDHIPAITINKMCGSGLAAMILAFDALVAGSCNMAVAGGIENMSLAPYILPKMRQGARMGHSQVYDHMFIDGLEDAYEGNLMGVFAEKCVDKYQFSREALDKFALDSLAKAQNAQAEKIFEKEIVPVEVTTRKGTTTVSIDELPLNARPEKIPTLKPAFKKDGVVTAANSSGISDGAAMTLMTTDKFAQKCGAKARARIIGHATHAQEPAWFTTAPVGAMKKLLKQHNLTVEDIDLFEINEAFAAVTLAAIESLGIAPGKVNIYGGACALGHPVGASGARIVATLLNALEQKNLKRGVASLCIGGGEACAILIERV